MKNADKFNVDISIIVPAYKSDKVISQCLNSLKKQKTPYKFEVIVVNSFPDKTPEIVHKYFPFVKLINSPERLFPGQARNKGIKSASGKYVGFLASDCTVPSDWVSRRMENHNKRFQCVSGIVATKKKDNPISLSEYWIEYSNFLEKRTAGIIHNSIPYSISFAREIFTKYGPYREDLQAGEDTLFNRKILESGEQIYFDPYIVMYHNGSTNLDKLVRHQFNHGKELTKYLFWDSKKWRNTGKIRQFLNLSFIFILKRIFSTYKRIFLGQRDLFLYSIVYTPFIFLGIVSISLGALKQLTIQGTYQKKK